MLACFFELVKLGKKCYSLLRSSIAVSASASSWSAERKKIQLCFFKANKTARAGARLSLGRLKPLLQAVPRRKLRTARQSLQKSLCIFAFIAKIVASRFGQPRVKTSYFCGLHTRLAKISPWLYPKPFASTAKLDKTKKQPPPCLLYCFAFAWVVFLWLTLLDFRFCLFIIINTIKKRQKRRAKPLFIEGQRGSSSIF